jgi:hypothetical protein
MGDDMKKSFNDLTQGEKAKLTRANNKAEKEFDEAIKEVSKALYGFLEKEIYPTRDSAIEKAEKVRDEKIAEAVAQYEKDHKQAMDWQENHPEVVRLQKIYDDIWQEQWKIKSSKRYWVEKSVGLQ